MHLFNNIGWQTNFTKTGFRESQEMKVKQDALLVKKLLEAKLEKANHFVTLFDESYNYVGKKGQMDTHFRLWDDDTNTVITQYLDSVFLGKTSAKDIFEKYGSSCASIDKSKIIQNSCDGPHTLHNSFKHGETASGWRIKKVLSSMYKIFDKSPSRRADFEKLTDSILSDYPLKFCVHKWVENEPVAKNVGKSGQK